MHGPGTCTPPTLSSARQVGAGALELIADIGAFDSAYHLAALDVVTFDHIELSDAPGNPAGNVDFGGLDDAHRADPGKIGRRPQVIFPGEI